VSSSQRLRRRLARSSKRRNGPGRSRPKTDEGRSAGTTSAPFCKRDAQTAPLERRLVGPCHGLTALGLLTPRHHTRAVVVVVFNLGVGVGVGVDVKAESSSNSRNGAENAEQ
jgi:hypothetical protein